MSAVDIPLAGAAASPRTVPARLVVEHASYAYDPERRDAPQLTSAPNEEKPAKKDLPSPTALLKIARRKLDADLAPLRITHVTSIGADDDSLERRRMNGIVDQFILYDIGRLSGKKAQWAKLEFDRLGQAAIPSLVYGVNKAAYYGQSCPIIAISRKLRDELSRSQDPAMIAYAGYQRLRAGQAEALGFTARARWPMDTLPVVA